MSRTTPLDDEIGRAFFYDGAPWQLTYNPRARAFALRRMAPAIAYDRAIALIKSGKLLWNPPAQMEPPAPDATVDSVREQAELLDAFRRSPACMDSLNWELRVQVDKQLAEVRTWLARRGLKSGNHPDAADSES
jgi:hypothetical protein